MRPIFFTLNFVVGILRGWFFPSPGKNWTWPVTHFRNLFGSFFTFLINHGLTSVHFVVSFACLTVHCLVFLSKGRSISRAFQVRMVKSKNIVKDGRKVSRRSCPDLSHRTPCVVRELRGNLMPDPISWDTSTECYSPQYATVFYLFWWF